MRRLSSIILITITAISLCVTLVLGYNNLIRRDQRLSEAFSAAQRQARAATDEISTEFAELMTIADNIAAELSDGTLAYTDIEPHMRNILTARPDVDGLAITFEPFVYNPDVRLFQTYVYKGEDGTFETLEGATYDYTRPAMTEADADTSWYVDTINEGAQWHEPFFATGAGTILVEYGVPFYPVGADEERDPAGIVSIDYTLADVRSLLQELELGATGYGFVMTDLGTFLTHPVAELVVNRTIFDVIEDPAVLELARDTIAGNPSFIEIDDPISGVPTWHFFEPIESTGWTMGVVMNKLQFQPPPVETVRNQMGMALSFAGTILLVLTTIFHIDRYRFTNFWAVSATFSILCVMLIGLAWVLTNGLETREGVSITTASELERYIEGIETPLGAFGRPEEVPTGILIQALQFPDPTSVTVNGYIWQRYAEDSPTTRGFSLPQLIGEEATIEEVRRDVVEGEEIIIWYIGVTLRQTYDTTRFPFDHRNITVRILPADLRTYAILTPDVVAYELINPQQLPGVDPQASINNWTLKSSRFAYSVARTVVNFGLQDQANTGIHHELRFSIRAQRVYLGPFIAYLLPGLIAAMMTFAYLLSGRRVGDNDEIVSALNYAAALFFVVAVIHTALRDQIAAVGITYMEYIYILLYLAIVLVAANIFIVARFPDWGIVKYRNNLLPKVFYWPLFAGVMLIVTLLMFVY